MTSELEIANKIMNQSSDHYYNFHLHVLALKKITWMKHLTNPVLSETFFFQSRDIPDNSKI